MVDVLGVWIKKFPENKLLELNNKSHYYEKSITLYFWQHIDYNVLILKVIVNIINICFTIIKKKRDSNL